MQNKVIQHLRLSDDLFDVVKAGYQTANIRMGRRDIQKGDLLFVGIKTDEVVKVNVTEVVYKKLGDMNNYEAQLCGAEDTEQMKESLRYYYPQITDENEITIIIFTVSPEPEKKELEAGCVTCGIKKE